MIVPFLRRAAQTGQLLSKELADSLDPEDGCLWICGTGDQQTMVFTDLGLECLRELIADHRRDQPPTRP